jgi:predicted dehydrogenase
MFGGDVHVRAYADLQRSGIAPFMGRIGMDDLARSLADVTFELVAVAARTAPSADRAANAYANLTGTRPATYCGDTPWVDLLRAHPDLDILAVATPDHLHTPPTLAALEAGCHVIVEKPLCLDIREADEIADASARTGRVVCVDMHKRYDPDHRRIRDDLLKRIGRPLYGIAYLEEPLEVSTSTFKWAEQSDPFTYVGPHWVDLFYHYFHAKPVGLTAVGQKQKLVALGIDAYDSVQVRVDWDNGMSVTFLNNWITPADFEGSVNQGHEIVGAEGKIESDQQYRGLRFWRSGDGCRTVNTHFTRDVTRPDGTATYVGYGTDSIHAGVLAACRVKFMASSLAELEETYPSAEEGRVTVAVVHAARLVREQNAEYARQGKAPVVTAAFDAEGITIYDPYRSPGTVVDRVPSRAL